MKLRVFTTGAFFLLVNTANSQTIKEWSLEKCIDFAYTRNITIRKSELNIRRFEINAEQAKAQRFPSAGISVNQYFYPTGNVSGGSDLKGSYGTNYLISSGIILFGASKITRQIKQAELNIQSGTLTVEATREAVSLNILNAFLQVLYAEEQVKNSEGQVESVKAQVNLAAERLNLKGISKADYAQIVSQLANEKLTLSNSESQLAIARINLMQLMELPVTDSFNIAHPDLSEMLNQNRVPDVGKIYETALSVKPQIKNASISKEIAALDEKIAQSGYYPVLSVSAGIGNNYTGNFSGFYSRQGRDGVSPSAGISLSIPIYQNKQVKTSVALGKLGYLDAELTETNARNELRKNIEQACQDVISGQVEYEASIESYKANLESSMQSDEKFRQGMMNSVDYLVSKTNLIIAESQLLQSKYNLIFRYKILDFYSGIPLVL